MTSTLHGYAYGNDLNKLNNSGCDVIFTWLTVVGFWVQCLANKYRIAGKMCEVQFLRRYSFSAQK